MIIHVGGGVPNAETILDAFSVEDMITSTAVLHAAPTTERVRQQAEATAKVWRL
jgi:hypothetical protein